MSEYHLIKEVTLKSISSKTAMVLEGEDINSFSKDKTYEMTLEDGTRLICNWIMATSLPPNRLQKQCWVGLVDDLK